MVLKREKKRKNVGVLRRNSRTNIQNGEGDKKKNEEAGQRKKKKINKMPSDLRAQGDFITNAFFLKPIDSFNFNKYLQL